MNLLLDWAGDLRIGRGLRHFASDDALRRLGVPDCVVVSCLRSAPRENRRMPLAVGTRLGPYEVLRQVGVGGMGEVYRARDTRLDRVVALKVLRSDVLSSERRLRFQREARAISALSHPHICVLHDIGCHDGTDFLVMEYVEGRPLSSRIGPGGLPLAAFLPIAIQLTDAVGAAHQRGIVHRDLKPANVMVTDEDHVKVLDFGLARLGPQPGDEEGANDSTASLTAEGRIAGTVAYMSPEQAEGRTIDHRSDIFSLGVVLYEMATGQRPFTGESAVSVLSSILNTPASLRVACCPAMQS
jgi:serine/threonine protein kinase